MAEMTSRERVLAAINHQEPDRVPLDVGGSVSTSIVVEGHDRLKAYLGLDGPTVEMQKTFRVARVDEAVVERLGCDCRAVRLKPSAEVRSPVRSEPGIFTDLWGVKWRRQDYDYGYYWEMAGHPLAEASIDDLGAYAWPDALDPGLTAGLAEDAKALYEGTDYAIIGDPGIKSLWEISYLLRGLERMLMDLVLDPAFVKALLERLLEINITVAGRFLDAVGPYIQVFRAADDLATQRAPLMSPATFRQLYKPYYRRYFDFVRSRTEAKVFFHSCGNVAPLLDDLIDIGVDIINPVQVRAMGDTADLKRRFGERVVFWGGVDTQRVLPYGSTDMVRAEVGRCIRDLAPGGGYVAGAVHNIQPDVPPENILAMAEAVRDLGRYPVV